MHATNKFSSLNNRSLNVSRKWATSVLALCIAFATLSETHAIIVASGGSNTTDPGTGVPWDNVIQVTGNNSTASGVYLGGGWVLTAGHVGYDTSVTINGANHTANDSMLRFQITNAGNSLPGEADLFLFRLDSAPSPDLPLTYGGLGLGETVTMIGFGGGVRSWGTNDIETSFLNPGSPPTISTAPFPVATTDPSPSDPMDPVFRTEAIHTAFDNTNGDANEGQASVGDSGGGVFYQDVAGDWVLGGIMLAIANDANSVQNTFIADLDFYDDQILGIIAANGSVPEPSSAMLALFASLMLFASKRRTRFVE